MPRVVSGATVGAIAVLLGALAHTVAGGSVQVAALAVLVAVGAMLGATAMEFGLGRWGLVVTIAGMQVAGHVLYDPVQGHRGGGHAHGVAGQIADANPSVFLDHLTGAAALMVVLHIAAAVVAAVLVGVIVPLLDVLARVVVVLSAAPVVVRESLRVLRSSVAVIATPTNLHHVVVRRGPPALV